MIILAGVLVHRAMRPLRNRCVAVFRVVVAALIEWLVGTLCVSIQLTRSHTIHKVPGAAFGIRQRKVLDKRPFLSDPKSFFLVSFW